MPPSPAQRRLPLLLAVALMLPLGMLVGGCAQFPRIDPSGERFLIWPTPAAANPAASGLPAIPGNVAAPPVFGSGGGGGSSLCPLCPLCPLGGCPLGGDCCLAASTPTKVGRPTIPEQLKITPERILAPVGSEVILKAGVCGDSGYLRTNRRIEWMLNPQGTGQFVTVGEQGEMDILRAPWQRPNKFDNTYAVGYTSPFHTCVNRGTADPSDDTQIRPGEAWITVSSPTEGASFVTAHAPESGNWPARRASATIYWVDAQWQLPPSISVQPGQSHTLVTIVTRESDGSPLAGYLVRYEVLEGRTARLGYEAGQTSEITTDAQGRASVLVTPTDDQAGMARVKTTVVRPVRSSPMPSPRLELGSGEAVVSWSPMATSAPSAVPRLPEDSGLGDGRPQPPAPFEPPPSEGTPLPSDGLPQLEIVVTRDSTGPVAVNDRVPITITVLNSGDTPASGILVRDAYDRGLANAHDTSGDYEIKYNGMPDLAPGESDVVRLEFTAITPGRQCHRVTVSAIGAEEAFEQQCIEVQPPVAQAAPRLEVVTEGEIQREVGQPYRFRTRVYNRGSSAIEGATVEIWHESEAMLKPLRAWEGHTELKRGYRWQLPTIQPGDSAPFEVEYECLAPTAATKVTVFVEGPGIETITETRAVEITPARGGAGIGGAGIGGVGDPPVSTSPLRGTLSSTANPAQVGQPAALNVLIQNTGNTPLRNVEFRVSFPQQLRPNLTAGMSTLPFRVAGNAIQFDPIRELNPGEPIRITIPYVVLSQHNEVSVVLEMRSADLNEMQSATTRFPIRSR